LLILYAHRAPSWKRFPATGLLALALGLMMLEMLHPDTSAFAGLGQIAFTICIAAPAFWVGKVVRNKVQLDRILYLIFLANALGAFVGFLQARYGLLMPAEFSAVGVGMNREMVSALTYVGANGQTIIRPPGLSDMPGGASASGMIAAVLGIVLALGMTSIGVESLIYLAIAIVGLATVFLTQIRIMLIGAVFGMVL